jgi:hypothetical protein
VRRRSELESFSAERAVLRELLAELRFAQRSPIEDYWLKRRLMQWPADWRARGYVLFGLSLADRWALVLHDPCRACVIKAHPSLRFSNLKGWAARASRKPAGISIPAKYRRPIAGRDCKDISLTDASGKSPFKEASSGDFPYAALVYGASRRRDANGQGPVPCASCSGRSDLLSGALPTRVLGDRLQNIPPWLRQ